MEEFAEYLRRTYGTASGAVSSYKTAIKILDKIFEQHDVLNFAGKSIVSISDMCEINSLYEFVKAEEKKMRAKEESIFRYGKDSQQSYPKKGFCSAAVRSLFNYRESIIQHKATELAQITDSKSKLVKRL